jgi:hypothetical protein
MKLIYVFLFLILFILINSCSGGVSISDGNNASISIINRFNCQIKITSFEAGIDNMIIEPLSFYNFPVILNKNETKIINLSAKGSLLAETKTVSIEVKNNQSYNWEVK